MNLTDLTGRLALDSKGFESLKQAARTDPTGAAKTVAKQFDAIFVNMMLKQMRDASPQTGLLDSSSSKMYTSMLDQQLSHHRLDLPHAHLRLPPFDHGLAAQLDQRGKALAEELRIPHEEVVVLHQESYAFVLGQAQVEA